MAGTGITVALIAVLIQIIYASKLMNVDSHQLADKEGQASKLNFVEAMSKVLKARDTKEKNLRQAKEKTLKRNSVPYEYLGGCYDNNENCEYWASTGECNSNPAYMHSTCQYSCGTCCSDSNDQCGYWASTGECYINPDYMDINCAMSCGYCYGGIHYKRDVTKNFGNSPPGTRDDSREQLRTDDKMKRAYELGKFIKRALTWPHSQGNNGSPGTHETG
ncbi:uncharacterized protein LOC110455816 [Mizuhopecten yessoensis]|uniref:uncharacterized protein LOC110455816 n=1 Tax=Mizuhopecten yessoensis TaxID=6573 RepID=UPI000B45959B|nr:uncharacterized protein LOC110455816 [Mizuhopecten yessoensis]